MKMLSRGLVPLLVFHLLVKEMSAFVLPEALRAKREVSWLDPDFAGGLPMEQVNLGDLSPGDDPWDLEGRGARGSTPVLSRLDRPPAPSHHDPQHGHRTGAQEKRMKVAPMDSIGTSLMSGHRNRKGTPSDHWEEYSE